MVKVVVQVAQYASHSDQEEGGQEGAEDENSEEVALPLVRDGKDEHEEEGSGCHKHPSQYRDGDGQALDPELDTHPPLLLAGGEPGDHH